MCGIAGIFTLNPAKNESKNVVQMCNTFVHRGPDDDGYFFGKNMFMGMRRLSIIDLEGGHQPLYNEDGNLVLVFNGEIYNYIELKQELIGKGHIFKTNSDAEVVLHLYEEKGLKSLDDLNGMFAFCLWDEAKGEGVIVRDRLGIKPLYYWKNNGSIMFTSELKALVDVLPSIEINKKAIATYLKLMFIPAPLTPFENVQKLMPASYVFLSRDQGIASPQEYWGIPYKVDKKDNNDKLKSEFLDLMRDSISLQLRSDVPVGIFLSGGVDSSMIVALAVDEMKGKVSTFNVSYRGSHFDEAKYAELVAKKFNCNHHTVKIDTNDVIRLLPKIIWHMDEPHADSAMVGTYMVSELASKYVKVVLNGTGGDELFAGYSWHMEGVRMNRFLQRFPAWTNKFMTNFMRKFGVATEFIGTFAPARKSHEFHGFFADSVISNTEGSFSDMYKNDQNDAVNKLLYTDTKYYMTDDLLLLLDKMTMATSIEGRVPILDHRLVEWAFHIDGNLKVSNNTQKFLLKDWLLGILPDEILFRPKMGFGAPVDEWMKNGLFEECVRLINNRPASRKNLYWGLYDEHLYNKLSSLSESSCFKLLNLELWFRLFLDGENKDLPLSAIG